MEGGRFSGIFAFLFLLSVSADNVPVLIWNQKATHNLPKALMGHTVKTQSFKSDYLDKIEREGGDVIIFLRDKFCLKDITKHVSSLGVESHVLTKLKKNMEHGSSVHLASVESPHSALEDWKKSAGRTVHELRDDFKLGDELLGSASHIMLVHLPERGDSDQEVRSSLKKSDNIIGKITSEMKAIGRPFTGILTGEKDINPFGERTVVGRRLLVMNSRTNFSLEAGNNFINISDCLMMYADNVTFSVNAGGVSGNWTFPETTTPGDGSYCTNSTAMLNLSYSLPPELLYLNVIMEFTFNTTNYFWSTKNVTMEYGTSNGTSFPSTGVPLSLEARFVQAPETFSYACSNTTFYLQNWDNYSDFQLNFVGFQLQVFNYSTNFGRNNNCIGFFSAEIWSILVAMSTLLIILLWGVQMLSNITVMDRYEEARGKAITINIMD